MNIGLENYISVSICTHVKSLRILVHRLGKLSSWNPVKYYHYKAGGENVLQFSTWFVYSFPSTNTGFIHHINPSVHFSQLRCQAGILHRRKKIKSSFLHKKNTSMPHSPLEFFKTYCNKFWVVWELIVPWKAF